MEVDDDVLWPKLEPAKLAYLLVANDLFRGDLAKIRVEGTYMLLHEAGVQQNVL